MAAVRRDRPLKIAKEGKLDATKRYRIWAQGATDQVGHRNYLTELLPHMKACTDPDFELDFKTMPEGVAADKDGSVFGGFTDKQNLKKFVKN